ncbi:hypothetical protein ACJMK2_008999 [Sinanodonta woodiana]|uniref:NADH dehydrogenase (ubiquinone) complex I, assembly factor 6 n=1 Tax=Sinanodonta woodiana TaxID=1069815 RepID=A0ABD3VDY6_SINWO
MAASIKRKGWKQYTLLSNLKSISLNTRIVPGISEDFSCRHNSSQKHAGSADYCVNLVRKNDYENFLCCLLLPERLRPAGFAIRAFNVEIAQVRDVVSDKYRGIMRMQFWKDAIDNIFKGNPPHAPVALELAKVIEKHKLNKIWFTRLMEARAEQLEADGFRSVKAVEDYGENTVSALLYLLLQCAGVKNIHADHVASHLGRAQGVVTLLRSTPYHSSKERVYFPVELLIKHGVSEESVIRGQQEKPLKDLVFDLASVAHHHLLTARNMKKDVPKEAIPIFLNSLICDQYLKKLQLADFSIFDKSLQKKNGLLPWQLFIQKMKKTY